MKKIVFPVLMLLAYGCGNGSPAQQQEDGGDSAQHSLQDSVTESPMDMDAADSTLRTDAVSGATSTANQATFNGTLVVAPQNRASITLSMGGTVQSTSLLPGAYIKKGTVVASLENPDFILLQQNYLEAYAQCEFLEKEYHRQQTLSQQEAASQKKFQQSKADYLSMKSRMEGAAAQLRLLGVSPGQLLSLGITPYIEVKAPISGYVADMQMNIGKHFSAGEPLCELIDKSRPMLRLIAYEKDLDKLKTGDAIQFRVNGFGKQVFHAVLISIGQQIDDTNRSLEVLARVSENDPRFRPGMYVTARLQRK